MFNSRFEWIPLYRASVFYKSTTTGNNCFVMILVCLLSVFVKWFETLLPFIKVQFIILFNTSNIQCMNEVGHAITNFIWLEKSHFKICSGRIKSGYKIFFIGVIPYNTTLYIDFRKNKTKEPYIDSIHMFWLEVSIGARTKVPAYKVTAKTN